jgi:hypothetical protein
VIVYLRELERRRIALVQRSTAERAALADAASPLVRKLAAVDRLVAAFRARPVLVVAAAAAVAFVGPSRLLAWAARAAAAYSLLRRI